MLGEVVELTGANKITNQVLLNGEHTKFIGSSSVEVSGNLLNNNGNRYLFNDITGAGKSLTFLGGVNLSHDTNNRILVYMGSGVTNFSSAIVNGSTAIGSSLYYRGTGTLNFTAANTFGGELRMDRGTAVVSGAGTFLSAGNVGSFGIFVRNKGEFTLDNTAGNVGGGRIPGRLVALENNGLFRLIGHSSGTSETAGPLSIREGAGRILMTGAGTNVLTFASVAYNNNASILDLSGITGLGVGNQVRFTVAPASANFVGGVEGRIGIAGDDFATYSGILQLTSGATTINTKNVTVASTAGLLVGMRVSGNGIAPLLSLTSGATTAASTNVTVLSTTGLAVGQPISGAGIPAGATVASVTSTTVFVLSAAATATATGLTLTADAATIASITNGTTFVLNANASATATGLVINATPTTGTSVVAFSNYSAAATLADAVLVPTATAKITSASTGDDLSLMRSTLNALAVSAVLDAQPYLRQSSLRTCRWLNRRHSYTVDSPHRARIRRRG